MNTLAIDDHYNALLKSLMDDKMKLLDKVSHLDSSVHYRIDQRYNIIEKRLMDEKMEALTRHQTCPGSASSVPSLSSHPVQPAQPS